MPKRIRLRPLTIEETKAIQKLAKSRTQAARLVQRAQLIALLSAQPELPPTQAGLVVGFKGRAAGTTWVKRFNEHGLAGLEDQPRPGRPVTHSETVRSQLLDLATQKPQSLGYPFALWTLSRLQTAFEERYQLQLGISTIWNWIRDEGLHWRRQESWFHEADKHDPEFVEKRGPSFEPT
jgi:transposase